VSDGFVGGLRGDMDGMLDALAIAAGDLAGMQGHVAEGYAQRHAARLGY
jgi:hypothetical protein